MSTPEEREAALLARLNTLSRDQSQARIARATGRSRTSVTRYFQGTKLPLEFGAALVEEFGVNPSWLLTGDEPMYLADVPAASAALGNELLELMRSIDNVAKLRLGALSGRTEARALREVSDTLDRYGSLSDRMNRMSAPILSDLLAQAQQAVNGRKMDRARALLGTADRLHRFCDDRTLSMRLIELRGMASHIEQDLVAALDLREQLFHATLASDAGFEAVAAPAIGLSLVLRNQQMRRRARRVARIGMAYADGDQQELPGYNMLSALDSMTSIELGEFEGVAAAIERAAARTSQPEAAAAVQTAMYSFNLLRGLWKAREIAGARVDSFPAAVFILDAALLTDDDEVVERALKQCRAVMRPEMPLNQLHVNRGEAALKALRGAALAAAAVEIPATGSAPRDFSRCVDAAYLLRVSGGKRAVEACLQAQRCLDQYPADRVPFPGVVALHLKNVLSAVPSNTRKHAHRELRRKAEELCAQRIEQGFGQLRQLLDEAN